MPRFGAFVSSALRHFGTSALRHFGTLALWYFGTPVLWHPGTCSLPPPTVHHGQGSCGFRFGSGGFARVGCCVRDEHVGGVLGAGDDSAADAWEAGESGAGDADFLGCVGGGAGGGVFPAEGQAWAPGLRSRIERAGRLNVV